MHVCVVVFLFPVTPSPLELVSPDFLIEGVSFNFTCLSTGGYPQPEITWLYQTPNEDTPINATSLSVEHTNNNLYNVNSTLTFTPSMVDDGNWLICQIAVGTNISENMTAMVQLKLISKN